MKILNINKLKNEQNNIALLKEFALDQSIQFLNQLSQFDKENQLENLKRTIKQFQPLVNKIYAEVLGYELIESLKQIDKQNIDIKQSKEQLMISTCNVLEEIEKNFHIIYDKDKVADAFAQISIDVEIPAQNNGCKCCNECSIS